MKEKILQLNLKGLLKFTFKEILIYFYDIKLNNLKK